MDLKGLVHRELGEGLTEEELASTVGVSVETISNILLMRPSKCARITSLKVHFYRQNRRLLSSDYALFDGRLSS